METARDNNIPAPDGIFVPDKKREEDFDELSERAQKEVIIEKSEEVTEKMKEVVYPHLGIERAESWEIPENAFWDLQVYIGMRETMAVHDGAFNFLSDTERDRIPFGHIHRHHIRNNSWEDYREMFREASGELVKLAKRKNELDLGVTVAIDITPLEYRGDRDGMNGEVFGYSDGESENPYYSYQWMTIQIVGEDVPIILDAKPIKKGDDRKEAALELLDNAREHVRVWRVLMDRGFGIKELLHEIDSRDIYYIVPWRKSSTEKRVIRDMNKYGKEVKLQERKLDLRNGGWYETNFAYVPKKDWNGKLEKGHENKVVFATNKDFDRDESEDENIDFRMRVKKHVDRYRKRWGIENSYKKIKEFMALTTSKNFDLRYFYFMFSCLLYNTWRLVDLLVKLHFVEDPGYEPMVTAHSFLTVAKKYLGADFT